MPRLFALPTSGLATRLFLAVLLGCAILVAGMALALRLSFQAEFLDYLDENRQERLSALADALGDEYRKTGSWDGLRDNQRVFRRLVGRIIRREPAPKDDAEGDAQKTRREWEAAYLRTGLGVLDEDGKTLSVGTAPGPNAFRLPILIDDAVVGHLIREPVTGIFDAADVRFQEGQRRAVLFIALAALGVAALVSFWAARMLNTPLKNLGGVLGTLAVGDFSIRAPVVGQKELRLFAEQLNTLAQALERNENARRVFMAEVSHDLRTPLAVLRGEIEAMQDGVRPLTSEALASLQAETDLLVSLVDDIHTLALADVGSLAYQKRPLDLAALLREIVDGFSPRFAARNVTVERDFFRVPLLVEADAGRLGQVFRNILENSLRYTNPGGSLRVGCRAEGDVAIVDVLDSAPGVPDEELPRLFERFRTGDPARTRTTGGSGLGLSICRTIIEAHAGTLRALPSPLGGVWMRLTIPLCREAATPTLGGDTA